MKRYFFDAELIEDGRTIDLVSIGVVDEAGKRGFSACNLDADLRAASPWTRENVIAHLPPYSSEDWMGRRSLANRLLVFLYDGPHPPNEGIEMWGYYADYDWVAFCQLFGRAMELPSALPKFCMDVKQYACMIGETKLPERAPGHEALSGAHWTRDAYLYLRAHERDGVDRL